MQKFLSYQQYQRNRKRRYIGVLLIALFLVSCAPVRTEKKKIRRGSAKQPAVKTQAIGHDIEVSFRGDPKKSILSILVNKKMDRYDRKQVNHVFERGLSGRTSSWTNPDQGNQYRITPLPALQTIGKSVCRKAKMETMLNGNDQLETINTKACRANNGQWRVSQEK